MDEKQLGKDYVIDFIEKHGGTEDVARRIGANRQTVRQIANGRNAPGFEFITKMTAVYPDFDLKAAVGKKKVLVDADGNPDYGFAEMDRDLPSVEEVRLATENAGLKREIKRLEDTISILLRTYQSPISGQDLTDLGKLLAANNATSGQTTIGFDIMTKRSVRKEIKPEVRFAKPVQIDWSNRARRNPPLS